MSGKFWLLTGRSLAWSDIMTVHDNLFAASREFFFWFVRKQKVTLKALSWLVTWVEERLPVWKISGIHWRGHVLWTEKASRKSFVKKNKKCVNRSLSLKFDFFILFWVFCLTRLDSSPVKTGPGLTNDLPTNKNYHHFNMLDCKLKVSSSLTKVLICSIQSGICP